jgi:ketol-acid reductoisomerase
VKQALWQGQASTDALKGKKVIVVGYGSQGRAHALNLKESGVDTTVALRANGPTWKKAEEDGFKPVSLEEAASFGDVFAMLTPDMVQPAVYQTLEKSAKKNATFLFAHGFNIHYKQIQPRKDFDIVMIAPKGPGNLVRRQYEEGQGVPCLIAVHQDVSGKAFETGIAYAHGLGGTRAGIIQTTFAEETETDLFGEQAVLCGGATELVTAGFETLVKAGYQPEVAYFECLHELKLIVDLIYEGGVERMLEFISETAKYGDFSRGPRVIDAHVRENMKKVLEEIQDGRFAKEWVKEYSDGLPRYKEYWKKDLEHPIEEVGQKLRANMSWLKGKTAKQPIKREFAAAGEAKR